MKYDKIYAWIAIAFMVLMVLLTAGCSKTTYVPVTTVKHDSIYQTQLRVDTLIKRDSVIIQKLGDTISIDRWHTIYKIQLRTDTLSVVKTDSVQVPYEVVKKEEVKYTPLFTKILAWIGGIVLFCFFASVAIYLYNIFKPS